MAHPKIPRNTDAINLLEDEEVKYWATTLGCSVMQLKEAVEAAGHSVENVKAYLKKKAE